MPKSPSRREDEGRILDLLQKNQELQDSLNEAFTSGRKKMQGACEHFAPGLDCDADTLKKMWLKMRQTGDTKKTQGKDHEEKRTRSSRAGSSEPSRRSLRLQGSSATSSVVCESTEASCSSSLCSSPPEPVIPKKSSKRGSTANNRSLCPISELAATPTEEEPVTSSQQIDTEPINEVVSVQEDDQRKEQDKEADAESVDTLVDAEQPGTACVTARESNLARYFQESAGPETKQTARQRHSEPSSITVQQSTSTRSWQDPTRVFFESMGLTVMGFPQHRQAEVKRQVSLIVHDLEYDLNSPTGLTVSS